jgi:hypothetical protein
MLGNDWQAAVESSRKVILEEFGERVTKIGWRYRKKTGGPTATELYGRINDQLRGGFRGLA